MKKSELKDIIKECVKEVLFEEGVLSNVIAEVAFGITKAQNLISEQAPAKMQTKTAEEEESSRRKKLLETKKRMTDALGSKSLKNVFEGTEPLPRGGTPGGSEISHSPLAGIDPNDKGVDISGLFGVAGNKWQKLK